MKKIIMAVVLSSSLMNICSAIGYYNNPCSWNRLAIQGAVATGGNISLGLVDYTEFSELGLTFSGRFNNASQATETFTPVVFGGLRNHLGNFTYFAYGIDLVSTFGRISGNSIQSSNQIGPYVSIEQMLNCHVMLAGWVQPYQYSYEKIGGVSTSTHSFFATGGIAINYLF